MAPNIKTLDLQTTSTAYHSAAIITEPAQLLHVSSQPGTDLRGQTPLDYVSQIYLALLNLHRVITAAGATTRDVVKLTLYIVNYNPQRQLHTRPLQKWLNGHRPAITLVPAPKLGATGSLFEIEAVVTLPSTPPSSRLIRQPTPTETVLDVVVIGAGLSGLTAAEAVIQSRYSCTVFEARDRVGGKTWTHALPNGDGVVDLGAAWINDTNQRKMFALARRAGVELIEQNIKGNCVLQEEDGRTTIFPYGQTPKITDEIQTQMEAIRDTVESECHEVDCAAPRNIELDSLTFLAYLHSRNASEKAIANASVWTRAMLGQEPQDISALYFLNYCKSGGGLLQMRSDGKHGAQYLRVRQGTQSFAKVIADGLPQGTVQLNQAVSGIKQIQKGRVLVEVDGRLIQARKVICSIPTTILRNIHFEPPLPPRKKLLVDSSRYGYYTKVMLVFRSAWWVDRGFCGLVQSFKGPASVYRDSSIPADGKWVLTAFVVGDSGKTWSALPTPQERERALLEQLEDLYGEPGLATREFEQSLGHEWSREQWSGWGCPCPAFTPGVLTAAGDALREPFRDVHFVGTETAAEWKGYMEGAVLSGERGANEVIRGLGHIVSYL